MPVTKSRLEDETAHRHVSFVVSPEIFVVERLEQPWYNHDDIQQFRLEVAQEKVAAKKQEQQEAREMLLARRKRGYQLLAARRQQRMVA